MKRPPHNRPTGQTTYRAVDAARALLGPGVRRFRREMQWRGVRSELARTRAATPLQYLVATHQTPLRRELLGVDEQLQLNKVTNLRLAASRLDGLVLEPGQRMSFWSLVGKPSGRRGFMDGLVLDHGRLSAGVGGGLCQMTNLLYWMTLHTPLVVVERWRHSYDVFPDASRTQPFGSGATCAWPSLDLQLTNPTTARYRLSVGLSDTHLAGAWTSSEPLTVHYEVEEREHRITHEGPGVYVRHNELWRLELDIATSARSEQLVAANHAFMMYAPFLPGAVAESRGSVEQARPATRRTER